MNLSTRHKPLDDQPDAMVSGVALIIRGLRNSCSCGVSIISSHHLAAIFYLRRRGVIQLRAVQEGMIHVDRGSKWRAR